IYLPYMLAFIVLLALAFAPMIGIIAAAGGGADAKPDPKVMAGAMFSFFGVFLVGTLILGPLLQAALQNMIWNHTTLGSHRFASRLSGWRLTWIVVSNFVLVAVTLGLFMPWAAVRLARYRAECTSLELDGPLDVIVAGAGQQIGAAGEETAELFDIDIGL
ncbi:MAG: DUF898 family protein, partial [Solimonas sp.]